MTRRLFVIIALAAASVVPVAWAPPASAGGGCHGQMQREGAGDTVAMSANCFSPTVLRVEPGQTVAFANKDEIDHLVAGVGNGWGSDDLVRSEQSFTARFDDPGVFVYTCPLHPGMAGAIVVGDGTGPDSAVPVAVTTPPASVVATPAAASSAIDTSDGVDAAGPALFVGGLVIGLAAGWRLRRRNVVGGAA